MYTLKQLPTQVKTLKTSDASKEEEPNYSIATSFVSSLRSFHNPKKHRGMSYDDFWALYLAYLELKVEKELLNENNLDKKHYRNIKDFIDNNYDTAVYLLTRFFKHSLILVESEEEKGG